MNDEPKTPAPDAPMSMSGEIWVGVGIVLATAAMIVQAAFFTGDRLSTTAEAINRLW